MGVGKSGFILSIIGGIGLGVIWYLNKVQNVDIPQIELIAIIFGLLFVVGIWVGRFGARSHLKKHGYLGR